MTEKLELVAEHREQYGLNRCLEAVGLSKGTWHRKVRQPQETRKEARDKVLKEQVLEVVCEHPAYGYRKIQREIKARGVRVNHKRL
ncbi:MAG TPA: transposase, partial [Candidatus Acetothermia bacterium]|nr:transposase [Candidatus Acetothermia bacterium]